MPLALASVVRTTGMPKDLAKPAPHPRPSARIGRPVMSEFAITGLATTASGPTVAHYGPYPTEADANQELAALRDGGLIHRTQSTVYELPEEKTA